MRIVLCYNVFASKIENLSIFYHNFLSKSKEIVHFLFLGRWHVLRMSESRKARISRILIHQFDTVVGWVERDITENATEKITFNFTENLTLSKTE